MIADARSARKSAFQKVLYAQVLKPLAGPIVFPPSNLNPGQDTRKHCVFPVHIHTSDASSMPRYEMCYGLFTAQIESPCNRTMQSPLVLLYSPLLLSALDHWGAGLVAVGGGGFAVLVLCIDSGPAWR